MADKPINLRLRRKQKARDEKRRRADETTAVAGVTRASRQKAASVSKLQSRRLDGHKLDALQDSVPEHDD